MTTELLRIIEDDLADKFNGEIERSVAAMITHGNKITWDIRLVALR